MPADANGTKPRLANYLQAVLMPRLLSDFLGVDSAVLEVIALAVYLGPGGRAPYPPA
jgi:hypothetical protein